MTLPENSSRMFGFLREIACAMGKKAMSQESLELREGFLSGRIPED